MANGRAKRARVPRPDRVRTLQGTRFGWVDVRLHRDGWLQALSSEALAVYAFLCVVANRQGVSYYRRDRIGLELGLSEQKLHQALARLRKLDLVAYAPFHERAADGFHQVLRLPGGGPPPSMSLADLPELRWRP